MAFKKRMLLAFILSVFCSTAHAQPNNQNRNSPPPLLSESQFQSGIEQITDTDSLLEFYTHYALQNLRRNPEKAVSIAYEILTLKEVQYSKRNGYNHYILGHYWDRPRPDSAIFHFNKAELFFTELRDYEKVVDVMVKQARAYSRYNEPLKSEEKYYSLIDFIETKDFDIDYQNRIINELSDLYMRVGAIEMALERYNQLLENDSGSFQDECRLRLKISNAYKRNLEYDLAKEQLLICIDKDEIDSQLKVVLLRSLSDLEKILGNKVERILWIEKAAIMQEAQGLNEFLTKFFLAEAYFENEDYFKADSVLNQLEKQNLRRIQPPTRINYFILRAKYALVENNFDDAIRQIDQAQIDLDRMPISPLSIDAILIKAEAYERKGDFQAAYELTKGITEKEDIISDLGRQREEEMAKVRLQMVSKNRELDEISSELGTVKIANAIIILGLLLIAFYIIYRFRLNSILRDEKTRNRIAQDLHDDLSGTLSSISFFSEAAKRGKDFKASEKYLERIDESASEAKEKINDIIWAIDPENDDWEIFLSKCRRYASDLFESKEIEYEINFDKDFSVNLNLETKQDLWLIFKEIVNNLAKHSKAMNSEISIKKEGKDLVLRVSDNGKGFDEKSIIKGNGLKNIRYRAKRLGAKVRLNSSPANGSEWELLLPI